MSKKETLSDKYLRELQRYAIGTVMRVDEYRTLCEGGIYKDTEGVGFYSKSDQLEDQTDQMIKPSEILLHGRTLETSEKLDGDTHVVWYRI